MKDRDERRTLAKLSGPARELVRVTCCELCSQRASNRERPERIEAAERRAAAGEACESCGEPFDASRVDARYCYGACRSARTGGASNNDTLHLVSYSRNTLRRVRPRRGGMGVGDGAPRRPRRGWSRSSSNTRMMLRVQKIICTTSRRAVSSIWASYLSGSALTTTGGRGRPQFGFRVSWEKWEKCGGIP